MKTIRHHISILSIILTAMVLTFNAGQASDEFPIATTTVWEMAASAAFDGTNYLVGIEGDALYRDNITAQLVSQSGTLVGSRISVGRTGAAPFVAFDGTNYLLVWADTKFSQCDNKCEVIYGQLISKSGTQIGSPFPISPEAGNNMQSETFGRIIFDGTNYFVVWDYAPGPNDAPWPNGCTDEYGQFVTPSGTLLGQPIKINTTNCGGGGATVAFDGTNILVAWGSEWNASGTQSVCWTDSSGDHCDIANIWGQFITKSSAGTPGTLSGSNFLISAASVLYSPPSIAFDGTNYLVIFAQETTRPDTCPLSGCKWDVYGQLVTKAGAPIGSRITISDTSPNHFGPLPVFNGTNYLVTWTEGFGSTEATVKGRFFDKSGGPVGSEFALFSPSGGRMPWLAFTIFDGSKYFSVINRGTPGIDPTDEDTYTNQDVFGALTQAWTSCTYSISPTSQSFGSSGGTGSVSVTTQSGCSWTAVSNASWITITSGSSGTGSGTVNYSVAANTGTSSRTGTITIADQTFTVSQDEAATLLWNGVPQSGSITGTSSRSAWVYYYAEFGSGATNLVIDLYSLSADADLYVRRGSKPTTSTYDCRSWNSGTTNEQCSSSTPSSGTWWICVNNYATGTISYTVKAAWSGGGFIDVPTTHWAYNYIMAIYNNSITVGCSQTPLKYCPDDYVTRGQMAAFIIRAKYGETFSYTTTPYFTDVPSTNTFFKYVQKLRDDGITVVSGTYGVNEYVTRGQMAAFIIRAKYGENFTYTQTPYFTDVPATHGFFKYVQKLKDSGITAVSGTYYVNNNVTRAEMAAFLARAFLGMQ